MPKASKPVAGGKPPSNGKAAKKGGKSKGSGPPLGLVGAGVALVAAVLIGVFFLRPGTTAKIVDLTFRNPSHFEVHLFSAPTFSQPQKLASLPPNGAVDRQAAVGERFFFSREESGATRTHTLKVDGGLLEYGFNPSCGDLHGKAGCDAFLAGNPNACQHAPGWMYVNCAATCESCHLMDPRVRCSAEALGTNETLAVAPGDIGRMFEGLPERFPQYKVKLLSVEPDGPYVATFDDFVTAEEARVVRQITAPNLARSTDQGRIDPRTGVQEKVTSKGRTSRNAWCDVNSGCSDNPVVKKLIKRISDVVQVPVANFEWMQVLQYDKGQEYNTHHDSSPQEFQMPAGPRLYTFFLYFDEVEEGGGTNFPQLNITVNPAKGKALLWPSCLSDRPNEIDSRTFHAALPVVRGRKLAANVWVRQRDYRKPNLWGCTGSFA